MTTLDLAALCQRHGASVLRRCLGLLGDRAEAEDATQEIFMTVMAKAEQFRGDAAFATWLYRVATNHCLNRLRDRKRAEHRVEHPEVSAWQGLGAVDPYARVEAKQLLGAVLARFDALDQQLFVLKVLDGLTQEQMAEVTGFSRRTIGTRLARIDTFIATELAGRS